MSIDYDFVHNSSCKIDSICGGLTEQQFNEVQLICSGIAWNEHAAKTSGRRPAHLTTQQGMPETQNTKD